MDDSVTQRNKRNRSNDDEEEKKMAHRRPSKPPQSKRSFLFYYFSLFSVLCFVVIAYQISYSTNYKANTIDRIAYNLGIHRNEYAAIIDAGSTGSRIAVLSIYKSGIDGSLKLVEDLFHQNKPGLSSFAENPQKGAEKIALLLEKAKAFIPQEDWAKTPIAVRATAGLRLLPSTKADALLDAVREIIYSSPFQAVDDAVTIMDGQDEGLYSWFTVNFLLDNLNEAATKSVATLDLGGGSVQITFVPKRYKRFVGDAKKYLHPVSIMEKEVNLYSYSYLGLGLMAARNEIFLAENEPNATNIFSSCVLDTVKDKQWKYGTKTYFVSGKAKNKDDIEKCRQIAQKVIKAKNVDQPAEVLDRRIFAFSYFFDRAAESGMMDSENGGVVTIDKYKNTAQKYCTSFNGKFEFMCLDLTIIVALLEEGFGLKSNTPIELVDTIDDHEISWAIGAAYSILSDKHLPKV